MQILNLHLNRLSQKISIHVGQNLWPQISRFIEEEYTGHSCFIISDTNVTRIYGDEMKRHFKNIKRFRGILNFPAGEESKTRQQKAQLEDQLLAKKAGRDSVIVAVGGGVTGDLAGFVAASLHRGVPLIQVPTSLLAQVDSSIGGKVGINHPNGKNLLGSFYHPKVIFTDIQLLSSLPEIEFFNGMAEVIKYAVTLDSQLLNDLMTKSDLIKRNNTESLLPIVTKSIQLKINVVEKDERETEFRSLLNFGHTMGHAIEKLTNYKVKHGFAVAAGMHYAARLSQQKFGYPENMVEQIKNICDAYALNSVDSADYDVDQLWEAVFSDKKVRQNRPHFTLLDSEAKVRLMEPVTYKEFCLALQGS